jgi:hypothetical protein
MRPWQKGADAVLPDELAAQVVKNGEAENSRPYPPPDVAPRVPVGTVDTVARPRRAYLTRKRG